MKKTRLDARFYTSAGLLVLLLLGQVLLPTTASGDGLCTPQLVGPGQSPPPGAYALYSSVSYGLPWNFVNNTEEGCFSQRHTTVEWSIPALLVDLIVIALVASLPYLLNWAWRRARRTKA